MTNEDIAIMHAPIDPIDAHRARAEHRLETIPAHVLERRAKKCATRASAKMLAAHQGRALNGIARRYVSTQDDK